MLRSTKTVLSFAVVLLLGGIISFVISSCQKQTDNTGRLLSKQSEEARFLESLVEKENRLLALSYTALPKRSNQRIFARMEKLSKRADWNKSKEFSKFGFHYMVVPIQEKSSPFKSSNKEAFRNLVFYHSDNGRMRMKIIEVVGKKGSSFNENGINIAAKVFSNMYFRRNDPVESPDAGVIMYTQNYFPQTAFAIRGGAWAKARGGIINQSKTNKVTVQKATGYNPSLSTVAPTSTCGSGCQTWESHDVWYWEDTNEIISDDVVDSWNICDGGAAPYGAYSLPEGTSPDNSIDDECANALQDFVDSSVPASEKLSYSLESENATTRVKSYQWALHKGIGWYIYSFERGTHVKQNDPTFPWKWKSLEHKELGLIGVVVGGTVEYSLIDAIATLGTYNATMAITYKIKSSIVCQGSPGSWGEAYTVPMAFNIND